MHSGRETYVRSMYSSTRPDRSIINIMASISIYICRYTYNWWYSVQLATMHIYCTDKNEVILDYMRMMTRMGYAVVVFLPHRVQSEAWPKEVKNDVDILSVGPKTHMHSSSSKPPTPEAAGGRGAMNTQYVTVHRPPPSTSQGPWMSA